MCLLAVQHVMSIFHENGCKSSCIKAADNSGSGGGGNPETQDHLGTWYHKGREGWGSEFHHPMKCSISTHTCVPADRCPTTLGSIESVCLLANGHIYESH